jgi:3-dehydroquinate dehydratase-2
MKIAIINGANLNLLGKREPDLYGSLSFETYFERLQNRYPALELSYFQSNHEGALIDHIQAVGFSHQGLIINAGAYTHTSLAIADALRAVPAPAVEVHVSNIFRREAFRHHSFLSSVCVGMITGLGLEGYRLAVEFLTTKP